MEALRTNLRSSFEEFHTKVAVARGKVRKGADNVLELNKMMSEVEESMERLEVVENAARKKYDESKELLMDKRSQVGFKETSYLCRKRIKKGQLIIWSTFLDKRTLY